MPELALLPLERMLMRIGEHATSTITFFESCGMDSVTGFLTERIDHIVRLNPWLAGYLQRGRYYYDDDASVALRVCGPGEIALSRDTPVGQMGEALQPLLVSPGCNGRSEALFKASLVPDAGRPIDRFALVVSMSHVIGDGHTFYLVHNMLSARQEPAALDATRRAEVSEHIDEMIGKDSVPGVLYRNVPFMGTYFLGILQSWLKREPLELRTFYVDEAWVEAQKAAAIADGQVKFVSTNDLITSWFFRKIGASLGIMAVNFRGRATGADDNLAGNYESLVLYRPADFATPSLIRASLGKMRRAAVPPTSLPSPCEHARGRLGLSTNWSTFAQTIELPGGAVQTLHLPHYDLSPGALPSHEADCVIFRPSAGRLACAITGSQRMLAALPRRGELIGEPID